VAGRPSRTTDVMNASAEIAARRSLACLVITAGLGASILFLCVRPAARLQICGDGSDLLLSVRGQDAWAFHWHN